MSRGRAPEPQRRKKIRCAIYTRKSTEEGLDQEFNSLDAQREACVAYIMSQRHEGWTLVPDYYDDGGFTGGNMDRPGLKQLLADIEAGKVDVIVVYKVDRSPERFPTSPRSSMCSMRRAPASSASSSRSIPQPAWDG